MDQAANSSIAFWLPEKIIGMNRMLRAIARVIVGCSGLVTVIGSGGGGGGDVCLDFGNCGSAPPPAPPPTTLSFPLQSALANQIVNAYSVNMIAGGDCDGTLSKSVGPANTATTFEGSPAFSATEVLQINLTNCVPASTSETVTNYVDSTYEPLGSQVVGGKYAVSSQRGSAQRGSGLET